MDWRVLLQILVSASPRALLKRLDLGAPRIRRTPTLLQMEAVECGAAALGIVLAHHGRWVSLERLRVDCGVTRDGSKASNVIKAARRFGFKAEGKKTEPAGLRTLRAPMIIHWNFNHFLVLEGIRGGRAYLNDPAFGPRVVSEEELDASFTGVALIFEPTEAFAKGGERPRLTVALKKRLTGSGLALGAALLSGLALVVPNLVAPVFSRLFIDSVLLDGRMDWLKPLLLGMAVTAVLLAGLTWLQQKFLLQLETRLAVSGSSRFLWHVLSLPLEFFHQRMPGDISSRVAINDRVAQLLTRDLATNAVGALMIGFLALVMVRYDPLLTLVGVLVVSLNVAALRFISRRRTDGSRRLLQEQGKLQGALLGGLTTIETVKATGGETGLFARWTGYQTKVVNTRQELGQYSQMLEALPPMLSAVNTALILGVGSFRVIQGGLSLGGLLAFQMLMASFVRPVNRLVTLGSSFQAAQGDLDRLDDVARYPAETDIEPDTTAPAENTVRLDGRLEIVDLCFGYSQLDPPLIENFNLTLEPGTRVALVGGSGSGKSTLAKLVTGLYTPWSGGILFDGKPRKELPRRLRTSSIAVVDQDIYLFAGTVRENLTLWDSTVPLSDVVAAAKDAAIHDDIAARPGGYDSPVAEGGYNWSGGQAQRLEIARALVNRPTVLILDEATSALDAETERLIDESLRRRGCTCLLIAHRLSTIRDADEIIVLERGKVVQRGTHEELLAQGGAYAQLIAME